jgi:acyl carrier protein
MEMTAKQEQAIELLAKASKRDKSVIKPEHEIVADLGIDSKGQLGLLMDMEEQLKIEIGDEDAARMNTVNDILIYVATKEKA